MKTATPPTTKVQANSLAQIKRLHSEILVAARKSLTSGIEIGRLLFEQKKSLPHGQWAQWLNANVPFTPRTATNYMRLWDERERLKTETVSDLTTAYRLLSPPSEPACDSTSTAVSDVLLDDINLAASIHTRVSLEDWVIESYSFAMGEGDAFPPVDLFETELGLLCADGFYRIHAARRAGHETIRATIHKGDSKQCLVFALGANADEPRGIVLTRKEREDIAARRAAILTGNGA